MSKMQPTEKEIKDIVALRVLRSKPIPKKKTELSIELTGAFCDLAMRLAPENLYEDGECPQWRVDQKLVQIRKEWKALELKAGRPVDESEFPY